MDSRDTIAAVATPPGRGGVGIVRVSGPLCKEITGSLLGQLPKPRYAFYSPFLSESGEIIDQGIALLFTAPHSFTGEDVLELQGHGGPLVLDILLQRVISMGARLARPGEFSERAFHNGKIDLVQAEAVADLIEADTTAAARLASRTLQGRFSHLIHELVEAVTQLRIYVEAAIDFPEEEVDFLSDGKVDKMLTSILRRLSEIKKNAQTGRLLRDGMQLVIAGRPNAGKSSLLNALAGRETAIVTDVPGTTRDLLREQIQIDGMPLHLIDTAGLREQADRVEQEGIRRARREIAQADFILWIFDDQADSRHDAVDRNNLPKGTPLIVIRNKIDLSGKPAGVREIPEGTEIALSAATGEGVVLLKEHLKERMNYHGIGEGEFIARRRHLDALDRAGTHFETGKRALVERGSGELLAEDLRQAQNALAEITGEFTTEDLLGRIFASFCMGK